MTTSQPENIILDGSILSQLRDDIKDVFNVERVETPRLASQGTILFYGSLLMEDSEAAYDLIAERWHAHDYTPMLRRREGQIALIAQPGVVVPKPSNPRTNLGLAIATIVSVWFTGAVGECGCFPQSIQDWLNGLPMMIAMMVILLAHEFGHYFAARYHKVAVTLPYFIPLPVISPVGTLGAFIQLRSPFKTKKQLFDIGVAGPLGGLIFAIPLIFWTVSSSPVNEITRGPVIAIGSSDQTARLWDADTEQEIHRLEGHTGEVNSTIFSSNGQHIVTASSDQTARLWDRTTGQETLRLEGHTGPVNSATFSTNSPGFIAAVFGPNDRTIVTASSDQTARLWDRTTGQEMLRLEGHTDQVNWAASSPDGRTIVTASSDQTARLWDRTTGQELFRLEGHTGPVNSATFSTDSPGFIAAVFGSNEQIIVTASSDQTARLWNASTGQEIVRLEGHTDQVNWATFSPDGRTIVTASSDQTARLWDRTTGQETLRLEGHTGPVNSATLSSDGQFIVTASSDQTVRLWNASTGREIRRFENDTGTINTAIIQNAGSFLEGNSIFYLIVKYILFGQLLPSFDEYSNLSSIREFLLLLIGSIPDGGGTDILINSLGLAAWFGLFITALNLVPVGQLDGGHIIYCLIGDKGRPLGIALIIAMLLAGLFWWPGWILWALLAFFIIGPQHPPPLNDLPPLGPGRKILAYVMIFIFVIMFMPNPLQLL